MSTLKERALLVFYSASQPQLTAVDTEASRETCATHGTKDGRAKVVKQLWDPAAYRHITTWYNRVRAWHRMQTLAWYDNGLRILPTAAYLRYAEQFRKFKMELDTMADAFVADYSEKLDVERHQLGTMFRESDYPSPSEVRARFKIEVSIYPVPDSGDFRLDQPGLSEVDKELIRSEAEARAVEALSNVTTECFTRLHTVVNHLAKELANPNKVKFHDSLIGNVRQLIDLLPMLNIAGNPALETLASEVDKKLAGIAVDDLKKDKGLCAEVATDAADLAKRISLFC